MDTRHLSEPIAGVISVPSHIAQEQAKQACNRTAWLPICSGLGAALDPGLYPGLWLGIKYGRHRGLSSPRHPGKHLTTGECYGGWCRALKAAGATHVGTHGIRHRSATDIANSGIPVTVGMALTAH